LHIGNLFPVLSTRSECQVASMQCDMIFVHILVCNILSAHMSLPGCLEDLVVPALIQCAVQCSAAQRSAVQCSAAQCSADCEGVCLGLPVMAANSGRHALHAITTTTSAVQCSAVRHYNVTMSLSCTTTRHQAPPPGTTRHQAPPPGTRHHH
jgi:hypothetical protein